MFMPSLGRVRRSCRGQEKFCPPVQQGCYGCSSVAQEILHTGGGIICKSLRSALHPPPFFPLSLSLSLSLSLRGSHFSTYLFFTFDAKFILKRKKFSLAKNFVLFHTKPSVRNLISCLRNGQKYIYKEGRTINPLRTQHT